MAAGLIRQLKHMIVSVGFELVCGSGLGYAGNNRREQFVCPFQITVPGKDSPLAFRNRARVCANGPHHRIPRCFL